MAVKAINPKGISAGGGSNGAPYVEKKSSLPPNESRPDKGMGLKNGPAARRDEGKESRMSTIKQKAPSRALRSNEPGGLKKR